MEKLEMVTLTCWVCHGDGVDKGGWAAEGSPPDVITYYVEPGGACKECDGKGTVREPHPKYF